LKSSAEIRQGFLDYFAEHDHKVVPSSPLVPANDPTLLFTNAGMVQFKDVFLGAEKRDYRRAVSSQRCVRAGGKHNDLDQVGYTARHHTFFEMLGNFSFGDYFKSEAIAYAWEFLTTKAGLSAERLWVTVYEEDDEAERIWREEIGVPAERVLRIGGEDNFWAMGDTGPCGPCTEIFYDHGAEVPGGPPGSADQDGDRYVEIWNLVFMQYDRDSEGSMNPLPAPCVDTGMGLERLATVLQGVHSNYDIDLFQRLIAAAAELTAVSDRDNASLKVIADHIRACAFLITDGVLPANEGRGYVLRRIIRRAVRHGYKLGCGDTFFWQVTGPLCEEMGAAYPELVQAREKVESTLKREEDRFRETLEQGMALLERVLADTQGDTVPGDAAFKLYDTYGFPLDLTCDIGRERGFDVDLEGFEAHMQAQRERGRHAAHFHKQTVAAEALHGLPESHFLGYETTRVEDAKIVGLLLNGKATERLEVGAEGVVILDRTPFYAESGGQVGDTGELRGADAAFRVEDTQVLGGNYFGHIGRVTAGELAVGDKVDAAIDARRRGDIVLHHSATHLLHAALRTVLGEHVEQKGSLVAPDRLRFDFTHPQPLSPEQLYRIEELVNEQIRRNAGGEARYMAYDDALESGAMALFGEKYGDTVRVMRFGDFSVELCGGTHVRRVGDIGAFKITSEAGISSGVRRIEAVAGGHAVEWVQEMDQSMRHVAEVLRSRPQEVEHKVEQLLQRVREQEREIERLKSRVAGAAGEDLMDRSRQVNGIRVLATEMQDMDAGGLREAVDKLKNKLGSGVVVLGTRDGNKVRLAAGSTSDLHKAIHAGKLVQHLAGQVGGGGGGRSDFAQAGGSDPDRLPEALDSVYAWVEQQLGEAGSEQ